MNTPATSSFTAAPLSGSQPIPVDDRRTPESWGDAKLAELTYTLPSNPKVGIDEYVRVAFAGGTDAIARLDATSFDDAVRGAARISSDASFDGAPRAVALLQAQDGAFHATLLRVAPGSNASYSYAASSNHPVLGYVQRSSDSLVAIVSDAQHYDLRNVAVGAGVAFDGSPDHPEFYARGVMLHRC